MQVSMHLTIIKLRYIKLTKIELLFEIQGMGIFL